jgi:hypothetical protein
MQNRISGGRSRKGNVPGGPGWRGGGVMVEISILAGREARDGLRLSLGFFRAIIMVS